MNPERVRQNAPKQGAFPEGETMRLIDLDDDRHTYCGDDGEYERWSIDPDVPVVDAIPIEYIKKWVLAQGYGRKHGWFITLRNFEKLIKDWEAENEID